MARFKQVPQNYLLRKLMEFWLNTVRNYNGPIRDDDFFDIIRSRCPQERFYLAYKNTNMDYIEALREECALKKDGGRTPIGFAA